MGATSLLATVLSEAQRLLHSEVGQDVALGVCAATPDLPQRTGGADNAVMCSLREAFDLFGLEKLGRDYEGSTVARNIERYATSFSPTSIGIADTALRGLVDVSQQQRAHEAVYDQLSEDIRVTLITMRHHEQRILDCRVDGDPAKEKRSTYEYINTSMHCVAVMRDKLSQMRQHAEQVEKTKADAQSIFSRSVRAQEEEREAAQAYLRVLSEAHSGNTAQLKAEQRAAAQSRDEADRRGAIFGQMQQKSVALVEMMCTRIATELQAMHDRQRHIGDERGKAASAQQASDLLQQQEAEQQRAFAASHQVAEDIVAGCDSSFALLDDCKHLVVRGCDAILTRNELYERLDAASQQFKRTAATFYDTLARHLARLTGQRTLAAAAPQDSDSGDDDIGNIRAYMRQERREQAVLRRLVCGEKRPEEIFDDTVRRRVHRRQRTQAVEAEVEEVPSPLTQEEQALRARIASIVNRDYFDTGSAPPDPSEHNSEASVCSVGSEEQRMACELEDIVARIESSQAGQEKGMGSAKDKEAEAENWSNASIDADLNTAPGTQPDQPPQESSEQGDEVVDDARTAELRNLDSDIEKVERLMRNLEAGIDTHSKEYTAARIRARESELEYHHKTRNLPLDTIIDDERNAVALSRQNIDKLKHKGLQVPYHSIPNHLVVSRFRHPKTKTVLPVLPLDYTSRIDETVCFMQDGDSEGTAVKLIRKAERDAVRRVQQQYAHPVHRDGEALESTNHDALLHTTGSGGVTSNSHTMLKLCATPLITVETAPAGSREGEACSAGDAAFFKDLHQRSQVLSEQRIGELARERVVASLPPSAKQGGQQEGDAVARFEVAAEEEEVPLVSHAAEEANSRAEEGFDDFKDVEAAEEEAETARQRMEMFAESSSESNLEKSMRMKSILPISYKAKREEWRRLRSELQIRRHKAQPEQPLKERFEQMDMADLTGISYIQLMRRKFDYGTQEKEETHAPDVQEVQRVQQEVRVEDAHVAWKPKLWHGEELGPTGAVERVTVTSRNFRVLQQHDAIPDPRVRSGIGKIISAVNKAVSSNVKEVHLTLPIAAYTPDLKSVLQYTYLLDCSATEWTPETISLSVRIGDF